MRHLVKTGMVDANPIEGEAPLWVALASRRYKMAKALVGEGADIDRVPPGQVYTAYRHALRHEHSDDQHYLILWGADTRPMEQHGTPWDPVEKKRKPNIHTTTDFFEYGDDGFKSFDTYVPSAVRREIDWAM